jgi:hypothetical protein
VAKNTYRSRYVDDPFSLRRRRQISFDRQDTLFVSNEYPRTKLQGLVKLSIISPFAHAETISTFITVPNPEDNALFGYSLAYSTVTNVLYVGSPGHNQNSGAVYGYRIGVQPEGFVINRHIAPATPNVPGLEFGTDLACSNDSMRVAVSVPGYRSLNSYGAVFVYNFASTSTATVITGDDLPAPMGGNDQFGKVVRITQD